MSKTHSFIRGPAPRLGEHNELILGELLGRSEADITELYERGVMGKQPINPRTTVQPAPLDKQVEDGAIAGHDPDFKKIVELE